MLCQIFFSRSWGNNVLFHGVLPNHPLYYKYFSIKLLLLSLYYWMKSQFLYLQSNVTCLNDVRRGFGSENRFIGCSLVVTTISSYTVKITVTIAHVMSDTKSSNSSSGHTSVPLELQNSSEVTSHSHILSYPFGMDHAQKTQFYCCIAQTTQKTSHMTTISPVHWLAVA
jgi:hypothetical protein